MPEVRQEMGYRVNRSQQSQRLIEQWLGLCTQYSAGRMWCKRLPISTSHSLLISLESLKTPRSLLGLVRCKIEILATSKASGARKLPEFRRYSLSLELRRSVWKES